MSGRDGNLVEQRSVIVVDIPDPAKRSNDAEKFRQIRSAAR
jgi:hypothetical protein